jgi:predicted nuclease of restriction endonuclease-like (RecB) superfamily
MKKANTTPKLVQNSLYSKISAIIELARQRATAAINLSMVYAYYEIGKHIVENEQQGSRRAEYGKQVLMELSEKLTEKFGQGFSADNLQNMRNFYSTYSQNPIYETVSRKFTLSWSHYLILMKIENKDERSFYEIEAAKENWSVRQLSKQYSSSLYERLALSRNKKDLMKLASKGQTIEKTTDILKNPFTLEFLGLEEKSIYTEPDLENKIINNMQKFLLEMGKGFLFEARQRRFTFDEEHFFVDLVLYNRLLQCYVLIDLKVEKLTHKDLGQMQMYVNYYDRYVKQDFEKPTIGILLCKKANQALVKLTLPKDANIYSAQYALYLPDKKLLQSKLKEWIKEFEGK